MKTPKLYVADTGLLCALLDIGTQEELQRSPNFGAVWETFVFAQLRYRERLAGRSGRVFFWRDRTREVDFLVDTGGRIELFEAKSTELPAPADAASLAAVRQAIGPSKVIGAALVSRAANSFLLGDELRAIGVGDLA